MCARFAFSGMPDMLRFHVCVDLIFELSGRLMEIDLLSGFTFVTGVTGRKKCPFVPASTIASCLVICIIAVDISFSVCLFVQLLMMIVLS